MCRTTISAFGNVCLFVSRDEEEAVQEEKFARICLLLSGFPDLDAGFVLHTGGWSLFSSTQQAFENAVLLSTS